MKLFFFFWSRDNTDVLYKRYKFKGREMVFRILKYHFSNLKSLCLAHLYHLPLVKQLNFQVLGTHSDLFNTMIVSILF